MQPAERTQIDGLQEQYSRNSGLDCSDSQDMARQEYGKEADINYILSRFGIGAPQRAPIFGEMDFDLDLQQAYASIHEAQRAYSKLPAHLREKYNDWHGLLNALDNGTLQTDLETPAPPPAPIPPVPTP